MKFHRTASFILLSILLIASKNTFSQSEPYQYNETTAIILYSGNGIIYANFEAFFSLKDFIRIQATKMSPAKNQEELDFLLNDHHYSLMLINPKQKQIIHLGDGWISDGKSWGTFEIDDEYYAVSDSILGTRIKASGNQELNFKSIEKKITAYEGSQGDYPKHSPPEKSSDIRPNKSESSIPDLSRTQDSNRNRSISELQDSTEFQSSKSASLTSNSSKSSESSIRSNSAEVQILASTPMNQNQNPTRDSNTQASASQTPFPIRNALLFALGLFLLWLFFHNQK